jgi:hypothetical protein
VIKFDFCGAHLMYPLYPADILESDLLLPVRRRIGIKLKPLMIIQQYAFLAIIE